MYRQILHFICLFTCLYSTNARKQTGITTVDQLRLEFLLLEQELWQFVDDPSNNEIKETENTAAVNLIENFERFGDKLYKVLFINKKK